MKIADTIWNKLGSIDVRDILQISRLSNSIDDTEAVLIQFKNTRGR